VRAVAVHIVTLQALTASTKKQWELNNPKKSGTVGCSNSGLLVLVQMGGDSFVDQLLANAQTKPDELPATSSGATTTGSGGADSGVERGDGGGASGGGADGDEEENDDDAITRAPGDPSGTAASDRDKGGSNRSSPSGARDEKVTKKADSAPSNGVEMALAPPPPPSPKKKKKGSSKRSSKKKKKESSRSASKSSSRSKSRSRSGPKAKAALSDADSSGVVDGGDDGGGETATPFPAAPEMPGAGPEGGLLVTMATDGLAFDVKRDKTGHMTVVKCKRHGKTSKEVPKGSHVLSVNGTPTTGLRRSHVAEQLASGGNEVVLEIAGPGA
jgi:hypothetical protein